MPTATYALDCWYFAALAGEVGRSLLHREILERPVLLFRTEAGQAVALEDRCPHRNVSLSLGKLEGDEVRCGYHGLCFGTRGQCTAIPGQQTIPPKVYDIRAYPLVERYGYLWIWPGAADKADPALIPDYAWQGEPGWTGQSDVITMKVNYRLSLENTLDLSHVGYVHGEALGATGEILTSPKVQVSNGEVSITRVRGNARPGMMFRRTLGWERVDSRQVLRYRPPGYVTIEVAVRQTGDRESRNLALHRVAGPITPATASSHHHAVSSFRNFALDNARLTEVLVKQNRDLLAQDAVILEDQQRMIERGLYQAPRLLASDEGSAAAIRLLDALIASQTGMSVAAGAD